MRFPLRHRLTVSLQPERLPETFVTSLDEAIMEASSFRANRYFNPVNLMAWKDGVTKRTINKHDSNQTLIDACLGVTFASVGQTMIEKNSHLNCYLIAAEGQRKMVSAIMAMHPLDRKIYCRPKNLVLKPLMNGANSVVRLAAALTEQGGLCYLTTAQEDTRLALDLLCEIDGRGACIQVKTGKPWVRHVIHPQSEEDDRLLGGTAFFNRTYSLKWTPILAVVSSYSVKSGEMIDKYDHRTAETIIKIIRSS